MANLGIPKRDKPPKAEPKDGETPEPDEELTGVDKELADMEADQEASRAAYRDS